MSGIDKVYALVKIAEAMEQGDHGTLSKMNRAFSKAIINESKNYSYESKIEVTREEKKLFKIRSKA